MWAAAREIASRRYENGCAEKKTKIKRGKRIGKGTKRQNESKKKLPNGKVGREQKIDLSRRRKGKLE